MISIERMIQLSLGVPDAIPEGDRRRRVTACRLVELAGSADHGLSKEQILDIDVHNQRSTPWLVLDAMVRAFDEGHLDGLIAGLSVEHRRGDEAHLVMNLTRGVVGPSATTAKVLAATGLQHLANWAQSNPNFANFG